MILLIISVLITFSIAYPLGRYLERKSWKKYRDLPIPGAQYSIKGINNPVIVHSIRTSLLDISNLEVIYSLNNKSIIDYKMPLNQWFQIATQIEKNES